MVNQERNVVGLMLAFTRSAKRSHMTRRKEKGVVGRIELYCFLLQNSFHKIAIFFDFFNK